MPEPKDAKNAYVCKTCGLKIVTINLDEGVTSMFMDCEKGRVECNGPMVLQMYQVPDYLAPTHAWYRPTPQELKHHTKYVRQHVEAGGLVLARLIDLLRARSDANAS